ncbi:DUF6251 family protein, partial [Streptomyces sp. NPDC059506]|uniref:DUF6251 family protein n=1 Tax=Streptomyces sp. NPDC059506 TaxID=3347751 RepID=UPI0036BA5CD1
MEHLPAHRTVVQLPDGTWTYTDTAPTAPAAGAVPQVVHVHQAAPDRTLQRTAARAPRRR